MFATDAAKFLGRLALILVFMLALAGCGDDAGDTDAHMDEHDHEEDEHDHEEVHLDEFPGRLMVLDSENHRLNVFDLETEQVVAMFDDQNGFESSEAEGFGDLLRTSSDGRFGFVLQRTGHFSPTNDPGANRIYVIDSGLTVEGHAGHLDPVWGTPTLLPYVLGHGAYVLGLEHGVGEMGLYRPIHWSSHHGLTAIFYDGSRHPEDNSQNANAVAVAYKDADPFGDSIWDSQTLPMPIFELDVGSHAHGGAVAFHDDLFIVSVGMNEGYGGLTYSTLPRGVAAYRADARDVDDVIRGQDFRGRCPRLHGEAVSGNYVAFGCNEGPEDNDDPDYMGPMITERSGVLVLSYDADRDVDNHPIGPFVPAEVAYPDDGMELTSGGLRGGTGPSKGIFMTTYGEHFLKITASDVVDGTTAGSELFMVEADSGRHRGYYFEPVDHNFGGEGRFVVLTGTDNLHIFDLEHGTKEVLAMPCSEEGCSSLALAPGFAYVTDASNNKVYEVHLEDAEIEREFDLNSPTSLVVFGWFELEDELVFH